ncbi:5'-3' exonuclease [Ornithinibacillus californiensis]|uniref:5'-3' exonuclease n=1 Tax=Ornithinibacillus californiensis TaxID=161536 RepID=UPI00064DC9E5|nr:5'-3' exonuclease H3TH domain-containing protein [Ornithinibacillus californiensis]
MQQQSILLVDGMALLFRGFFATSYRGNFMRNENGVPTNGIYQFLRYLLDAVDKFQPTHVVCCWDMGSKTFRTTMYEDYKGNRSAPPKELVPQFDLAKEVVDAFEMPNVGLDNFEADDCIGTLAKQYSNEHQVLILTGDQDILQLVEPGISVAIMRKGQGNYEVFTEENFYEKKGLYPKQIIDLKGLMGDTSDNYPGVKGIGEKTALKLLQEHETIDGLLENVDQLPKGVQSKIKANLDMLHLSRKLAEIRCDVPITVNLEQATWTYNREKVSQKFADLQINNLTKVLS